MNLKLLHVIWIANGKNVSESWEYGGELFLQLNFSMFFSAQTSFTFPVNSLIITFLGNFAEHLGNFRQIRIRWRTALGGDDSATVWLRGSAAEWRTDVLAAHQAQNMGAVRWAV